MSTMSTGEPFSPPVQQVQLQLQDLQTLLAAVDLAARRGAYQASEMSQIGGTFDRVNAFLQGATGQPTESTPEVPSLQPTPVTMPPAPPFAPKVDI